MGKLPTITRIITEDLPAEHRQWFSKVLVVLNSFISVVMSLLNKNLTIDDNMDAMIYTVDFQGRDLSSETGEPIVFKSTLKHTPKGVVKLQILDISESVGHIIDAVDLEWQYLSSQKIQITNITGISTDGSKKYRLTVLVI